MFWSGHKYTYKILVSVEDYADTTFTKTTDNIDNVLLMVSQGMKDLQEMDYENENLNTECTLTFMTLDGIVFSRLNFSVPHTPQVLYTLLLQHIIRDTK